MYVTRSKSPQLLYTYVDVCNGFAIIGIFLLVCNIQQLFESSVFCFLEIFRLYRQKICESSDLRSLNLYISNKQLASKLKLLQKFPYTVNGINSVNQQERNK